MQHLGWAIGTLNSESVIDDKDDDDDDSKFLYQKSKTRHAQAQPIHSHQVECNHNELLEQYKKNLEFKWLPAISMPTTTLANVHEYLE